MAYDEERGQDDFKTMQRRYLNAHKKIAEINEKIQELNVEIERIATEMDQLELEQKSIMDSDKRIENIARYNKLKEDLGEVAAKRLKLERNIGESRERIDLERQTFTERIPGGKELLDDMRKADLQTRKNIRIIDVAKRGRAAAGNLKSTKELYKTIDMDPDLKANLHNIVKNQNRYLELLEKQEKGTITTKELEELANVKNLYSQNKADLEKYCQENEFKDFDIDDFEKKLLSRKGITLEESFEEMIEEKESELDDLLLEKNTIEQYYQTKVLEIEPETLEQQVEEELDEEYELLEPTLWQKFRGGASNFFNKVRNYFRRDEEEEEIEVEQEQPEIEEPETEEISDKFKDKIQKSEFFKQELAAAAKGEDKEIEEVITRAKEEARRRREEQNNDELER